MSKLRAKPMQGSTTPSLKRLINVLICALSTLGVCVPSLGQEGPVSPKPIEGVSPAEPARKEAATSNGKSSLENVLPPPAFRYLYDKKTNEPVAVPYDVTLEDLLRAKAGGDRNQTGPKVATINAIAIDGVADDERATLKVTFTIRLLKSDQFVSVPLYLNEAVLIQPPVYTGYGEESPFEKKDPEFGYVWWFRGRGRHDLELTVSVPLKKQLPSRRLVLSLPPSPVSRAKLILPGPSLTTKASREQTSLDITPTRDARTLVDAIDLGTRFDLTWNPAVEIKPSEASLESQTIIRAQIEADQVVLRAEQQVKSLQGQFDKFNVRLPSATEQFKLDDPERLSYTTDPKNPTRVAVTLKEKSNSAQLFWTVNLPTKSKVLMLDGFLVEGAKNESVRKQVGRIGLSLAEGLRFTSEPSDPNILRINAGEFPASLGPVVRAYQFLGQPFKLTTKFDEVKPYFQVKPQFVLKASAQQLELDGVFDYRVDRDSLNEVILAWPDLKAEGWTLESVDEPGVVESHAVDEKGQITVRLVKHQPGGFSLHLRATRPVKPGEEMTLTLPRPKSASRLSPTSLILANAENVETELTSRGETFMQLLSSTNLELPESVRGRKVTAYRVDTDEQRFSLRVTPQKQRVRTDSLVEAHWQDNQFQIVQHLIYDVSYERLSQIRVAIPATLEPERIRFYTSRDVELTSDPIATPPGTPRQILLKLGEGHLGRFEIQARYAVPFAKDSAFDTDAEVALPILGSSDEAFSEVRVSLLQSDWFDAEPVSRDLWKPQFSRQEAWQWLADGSPAAIPLKLVRSTHATGKGNVSHALITAQVDGTGQGIVRAQFRVSTRSTALPVVLPATATLTRFYWDERLLQARDFVESPAESRKYTIQIPEESDKNSYAEHLLTIEYQDRFSSILGWSERLEMRPPTLPRCLWDGTVIWQTVMPKDQHLFTYPSSATPRFHWKRNGIIWSRQSDYTPQYLSQWVTPNSIKPPAEVDLGIPESSTNRYVFVQFGSPQLLAFQTMNSSMVLFFGAGFSLVVGFILLRLVVLRHVMTVLLLSLVIATFGLWYSAPLELLVQPMIAGLIFPATAVLLDSWIRRRSDTGILSFENQGEFPPIQAFGSHHGSRQADPNEVTVHRAFVRDSQSSLPVESGSGVS
ncbi:hypothetical protein [Schlesneria sp. T3-172]|uniref:hypothetical protein n=2 Tax=Schlesneria TaxID=656899 RepID=UPI0037C94E48